MPLNVLMVNETVQDTCDLGTDETCTLHCALGYTGDAGTLDCVNHNWTDVNSNCTGTG